MDRNKWGWSNQIQFENLPSLNSSHILIQYSISTDIVTALEIDKQNNLWIGTNDGVVIGTINEQNFQLQ